MDNLIPQIKKIIEKTQAGKIRWTSQTSNNYRWSRLLQNRTITFTIQESVILGSSPGQVTPRQMKRYVLTLSAPPEMNIQINTQVQPEYNDLLTNLYNVAVESSTGASADFLDKILGEL